MVMLDIWTVSTYRDMQWEVSKFLDEKEANEKYISEKLKGSSIVLISKVIEGCVLR